MIFVFLLLSVLGLGAVTAHADIIIDNGGSGTSFTGTWAVSGGTAPYGANSLWARDGATYRWQFTSQPAGTYEVFMWWSGWSSRATNVPVTIVHRDGSNTVSVNQQLNAGKWNSLGQFYFNGTGTVTIVAANGSTVSTSADAVRFVNVGGGVNQPPTAVNDTASTSMNTPVTVNVISNDADDGGIAAGTVTIAAPPTNGTAVPNGSGTVTYTPDEAFTGMDTFRYTVADTQGAVSNQAAVTVTVNAVSAEVVIDNGGPGTSFTGTWGVSGANNSYGSASVWSRDGAKYNWRFTPTVTGYYDLSMWWTVWSSRSTNVPVDIQHSGGTSRVAVNQQLNGGKWNSMGRYSFIAGQPYAVTVTSQPGPSSTSADAVKLAYSADIAGYVAIGDSITFGSNDDITADGIGYEPILSNLTPVSNSIANEGVGGVSSADGAAFISATLSKYPSATYYLVLYGTNDADTFFGGPTPSGKGLSAGQPGYSGSYKDYMQRIITAIKTAGKTPYLAKVPFTPLPRYSDATIQEYNDVIVELVAANGILVTPPDFYTYFKNHQGELADGLHPNGTGYQSMANLWFGVLP